MRQRSRLPVTTLTVVCTVPDSRKMQADGALPVHLQVPIACFFFKLVPEWYSHLNQNAILEDDQIFLHKQGSHEQARAGGFGCNAGVLHAHES